MAQVHSAPAPAPPHLQLQHQYQAHRDTPRPFPSLQQELPPKRQKTTQQASPPHSLAHSSSPLLSTHTGSAFHDRILHATRTTNSNPYTNLANISYPLSYLRTPLPESKITLQATKPLAKPLHVQPPIWEEKGPVMSGAVDAECDVILESIEGGEEGFCGGRVGMWKRGTDIVDDVDGFGVGIQECKGQPDSERLRGVKRGAEDAEDWIIDKRRRWDG
ncbi:hypothetical protein IAQ61_005405 [Plenodomus lingam]|uniref:Predicted protein n=1 Tax=Leptosphaeria maculans (strain JN3 / isolate v23.1.3 / race Av1-4-5-6-7-8) TaxID=985895 RepID=E4ZZD7_LEPMJ|nr:predicted protein [Plenodomus lingam JN3]KAH9871226.1 hypothetical protein IAQ61_005405 [Plenodomus lingam]CBX96732.1 predicted protein [Plenodomus lingam JN3]